MPTLCGIDIGSSAVKVAVVRSSYRRTTLEGLATVDIAQAGGVAEAIRAAVLAAHGGKAATGDGVAVALDGVSAAVRVLTMPASAQKQLTEVLAFELESQVPFDMDAAVFDHRVLPAPKGAPKDAPLTVVAAVARIEDVRARIDLVKAATGLEPERVAVGAFALAHLVPHVKELAEPGPVVVLDLGTAASDILVLEAGEPIFARTLSQGTQGLPATAPRLAREIRMSLAAFRAAGGATPTSLVLCGGGAFVTGAEAFLANELRLPVAVLPMPAVEAGETPLPPESTTQIPRYAKSLGLALGLAAGRAGAGLDLRRGPLAYERGFGWVKEKVPMLAGIAAVILVSFLFSTWTRLYALGRDQEVAGKALAVVTKEVLGEETTSAARAQELLGQQTTVNDEDPMTHADAFDVMVKLSEVIPASMVHDIEELDVQKGHVVVRGIVGSIPDAQSIAQSLQVASGGAGSAEKAGANDGCFQDVKVTRTNKVVGGDRVKYVLEFDLKCPADVKGKKPPTGTAGATPSAGGK